MCVSAFGLDFEGPDIGLGLEGPSLGFGLEGPGRGLGFALVRHDLVNIPVIRQ